MEYNNTPGQSYYQIPWICNAWCEYSPPGHRNLFNVSDGKPQYQTGLDKKGVGTKSHGWQLFLGEQNIWQHIGTSWIWLFPAWYFTRLEAFC